MLSRTIADSKKLSEVSERAALVYLLLLPQHDGEGLIEADSLSLLVAAGRFAISHGWTQADFDAVRAELVNAELWVIKDGPHGEAAEYANWQNHQRLDKIGRGSSIAPDSDETPGNSGKTSADYGETPALKGREGKVSRREGEVEVSPAPQSLHDASSNGDTWKVSEEETRIRLSLVPAMPSGWYPSGMESYRIREYARGGACRRWPGDELRGHLCAQADKIAAKRGRRPDGLYLLDQINADWDPPAPRRSNGGAPEQVYEDWTGRGQSEDPFGVQEET